MVIPAHSQCLVQYPPLHLILSAPYFPLSFSLSAHPLFPTACLHWCVHFSMLRVCPPPTSLHPSSALPPALRAAPPLLFTSARGAPPAPPPLDHRAPSLPPGSPPALCAGRTRVSLSAALLIPVFPSRRPCGCVCSVLSLCFFVLHPVFPWPLNNIHTLTLVCEWLGCSRGVVSHPVSEG